MRISTVGDASIEKSKFLTGRYQALAGLHPLP
jgi:hypothetical protein